MNEVYTDAAINVLDDGKPPTCPWQMKYQTLLLRQDLSGLVEEAGRIFEAWDELPSLTVHLEGGTSIEVSRRVQDNSSEAIDRSLHGIFRDNASVLGVTFPAFERRKEHTATRAQPTASPLALPSANIVERLGRGEIDVEQAIELLGCLSTPDDPSLSWAYHEVWLCDLGRWFANNPGKLSPWW
jgi:hypothetical protein